MLDFEKEGLKSCSVEVYSKEERVLLNTLLKRYEATDICFLDGGVGPDEVDFYIAEDKVQNLEDFGFEVNYIF